MSYRSFLLLAALAFGGAALASAQAADSFIPPRQPLSVVAMSPTADTADGTWTGTIETPGPSMPFNLVIRTHGDSLTGTVRRSSGDVALLGTIRSDTLTFYYTILYNDHPFTVNLHGVLNGDTLKGQADYGEGNIMAFDLKRVREQGK